MAMPWLLVPYLLFFDVLIELQPLSRITNNMK